MGAFPKSCPQRVLGKFGRHPKLSGEFRASPTSNRAGGTDARQTTNTPMAGIGRTELGVTPSSEADLSQFLGDPPSNFAHVCRNLPPNRAAH